MAERWERQPGESARAYEAAQLYFTAGPDRAIAWVSQKLAKSVPFLKRWSRRWEWVARALAYDDWLAAQSKALLEKAAREQVALWQARDEADRQRKFDLAQKLMARIDKMLEFPLATVVTESTEEPTAEGTLIIRRTTVRPVRWSLDTTSRLCSRAFKMSREAIRNEGSINDTDIDLREETWEPEDFKP